MLHSPSFFLARFPFYSFAVFTFLWPLLRFLRSCVSVHKSHRNMLLTIFFAHRIILVPFFKKVYGTHQKETGQGWKYWGAGVSKQRPSNRSHCIFFKLPLEEKKCRKKPHSSSSSVTAFQNLPGALRRRLPVKRNDAVIFFNTKERKINTSNKRTQFFISDNAFRF